MGLSSISHTQCFWFITLSCPEVCVSNAAPAQATLRTKLCTMHALWIMLLLHVKQKCRCVGNSTLDIRAMKLANEGGGEDHQWQ